MSEKIRVLLSEEEVDARIQEVADVINKDYEGKEVHMICVLKGGVFFGPRQQKGGDGIAKGQRQRLRRRVARDDIPLPDAEAGGGNQMYEVGIGMFHDDPPDTDL